MGAAIPAAFAAIGSALGSASVATAVTTAATAVGAASGLKSLISKPKIPDSLRQGALLAASPTSAPRTPGQPLAPTQTSSNRSLAALAPGLALAGTGSNFMSASRTTGKSLLGQ